MLYPSVPGGEPQPGGERVQGGESGPGPAHPGLLLRDPGLHHAGGRQRCRYQRTTRCDYQYIMVQQKLFDCAFYLALQNPLVVGHPTP